MSSPLDTIAALATPTGTAALAVIRISGSDTERLTKAICGGTSPAPRRAMHLDYRDRHGAVVDDVLVTFFKGPHSYSGEDTLEISTHGNPFIAQTVLEDLYARGCRPAEPGEFTQRAFLNGKMDLSQAEAVMDLIHARSERALAAANAHLRGALARRMEGLVTGLLKALAQIEAYIDFPDEDLPVDDKKLVTSELDNQLRSISDLAATSRFGEMLRDGLKTVLVGAPNVGKSSLLNALIGRDRALVSPEPGTTRDFLEERLIVGPHCLRLIDTAGLNPTPAPLERLGIAKTLERVEEAELFLLVFDVNAGAPLSIPPEVRSKITPQNCLVVFNKSDLLPPSSPARSIAGLPDDLTLILVSALSGAGLDRLRGEIVARADAFGPAGEESIAINARHGHALAEARESLLAARAKLAAAEPTELVASDLRAALDAYGRITGRIDNERMLDELFATFCIGK